MSKVKFLWPLRGGTWKERALAMAFVLDLGLIGLALYHLSWFLCPAK